MLFYNFSKKNFCQLKSKLQVLIPNKQTIIKELITKHRKKNIIKNYTGNQFFEGIPVFYETSNYSRTNGIKYRGYRISEVIEKTTSEREYPQAESMIWTFMTGEIPTIEETKSVVDSLNQRKVIPEELIKM